MLHADFHIGTEFSTAAGKWRCTDVGSRVIVAISLEPRTITRIGADKLETQYVSDDPKDLLGPPYTVAEHVFDEYDLEGCAAVDCPRKPL